MDADADTFTLPALDRDGRPRRPGFVIVYDFAADRPLEIRAVMPGETVTLGAGEPPAN